MDSGIIIIFLIIFLCIISYYFGGLQLLTAIGTIATVLAAFYFGLFGKIETRILLKREQEKLDNESFKFLVSIINNDYNGVSKAIFIKNFQNKIFSSYLIGTRNIKKYKKFVKLANSFDTCESNCEKIFQKIVSEVEKLQSKVDEQTKDHGLNSLLVFAAKVYWHKNIFEISPKNPSMQYPIALVYTDTPRNEGTGRFVEDAARTLIDKALNKPLQSDDYYRDQNLSHGVFIYPDTYKFIKKTHKKIIILYKNKKIILEYKMPYFLKK